MDIGGKRQEQDGLGPGAHAAADGELDRPRELLTVRAFAERWSAFTQPALRSLILGADERLNSRGERIPGNGLADSGAVVRIGRRVLIDERAFFGWIAAQQRSRKPAP